jgi:hypothetical protein
MPLAQSLAGPSTLAGKLDARGLAAVSLAATLTLQNIATPLELGTDPLAYFAALD